MHEVKDGELQDVIEYLGRVQRDASGAAVGVAYQREGAVAALVELRGMLTNEAKFVAEEAVRGSRAMYDRAVFTRLCLWRVPTSHLVPLLLHVDPADHGMTVAMLRVFLCLMVTPTANTNDIQGCHRLVAEIRLLFVAGPVLHKLRRVLVPLFVKRRQGSLLTRVECDVLALFLELVRTLLRLPDLATADGLGASTRVSDRLVTALADAQLLELLLIVFRHNRLIKQNRAEAARVEGGVEIVPRERPPAVTESQRVPGETQYEHAMYGGPQTQASQEEIEREPAATPASPLEAGARDFVAATTQLSRFETQLEIVPAPLAPGEVSLSEDTQRLPTIFDGRPAAASGAPPGGGTPAETQVPTIFSVGAGQQQQQQQQQAVFNRQTASFDTPAETQIPTIFSSNVGAGQQQQQQQQAVFNRQTASSSTPGGCAAADDTPAETQIPTIFSNNVGAGQQQQQQPVFNRQTASSSTPGGRAAADDTPAETQVPTIFSANAGAADPRKGGEPEHSLPAESQQHPPAASNAARVFGEAKQVSFAEAVAPPRRGGEEAGSQKDSPPPTIFRQEEEQQQQHQQQQQQQRPDDGQPVRLADLSKIRPRGVTIAGEEDEAFDGGDGSPAVKKRRLHGGDADDSHNDNDTADGESGAAGDEGSSETSEAGGEESEEGGLPPSEEEESVASEESDDRRLAPVRQDRRTETDADVTAWTTSLLLIIVELLRSHDLSQLALAGSPQAATAVARSAGAGVKRANPLLSSALQQSLQQESLRRAAQQPGQRVDMGRQGFFVRSNKIIRAETLVRGGFKEAAPRVTRKRAGVPAAPPTASVDAQTRLSAFLQSFLENEGVSEVIAELQEPLLHGLSDVGSLKAKGPDDDDDEDMRLPESEPGGLRAIIARERSRVNSRGAVVETASQYMTFAAIVLAFRRHQAALQKTHISLHNVTLLLKAELLSAAFSMISLTNQMSGDAAFRRARKQQQHDDEEHGPPDVLNDPKRLLGFQMACVRYVKEAIVVLSSLLRTHRPKPGATEVSPAYTASKALAASVLHDHARIQLLVKLMKECEVHKHPAWYRSDLLQAVHVVLLCLEDAARDGTVFLQRKKKKKLRRKGGKRPKRDDDDEVLSGLGLDDDEEAAGVASERSASVRSEWTDEDREPQEPAAAKAERRASREKVREARRVQRHAVDWVVNRHGPDADGARGVACLLVLSKERELQGNAILREDPGVGLSMLLFSKGSHPCDDEARDDTGPSQAASAALGTFGTFGGTGGDSDANEPNMLADAASETSEDTRVSVVSDHAYSVTSIALEFVQPKVVQTYIDALKTWQDNSDETNACIVAFLSKVAFELNLAPCVLSVEALQVYEKVLRTLNISSNHTTLRHAMAKHAPLASTLLKLVRRWFALQRLNPSWCVYSLTWLNRYEAEAIIENVPISLERSTKRVQSKRQEAIGPAGLDDDPAAFAAVEAEVFVAQAGADVFNEGELGHEAVQRAEQWKARQWTEEDVDNLTKAWQPYIDAFGDGFVAEIKKAVFKDKTCSAKLLLQRATNSGLVVPPTVRALPAPPAKWSNALDDLLRKHLPEYYRAAPPDDEKPLVIEACLARLRTDHFPQFAEEQVLKRAKLLKIPEATALASSRLRAIRTFKAEQKRGGMPVPPKAAKKRKQRQAAPPSSDEAPVHDSPSDGFSFDDGEDEAADESAAEDGGRLTKRRKIGKEKTSKDKKEKKGKKDKKEKEGKKEKKEKKHKKEKEGKKEKKEKKSKRGLTIVDEDD
ncbi:hypothetical protein DIPPA_05414 [Diplonema papillatum]|nr:hypothetical protein DIPPA_05414 [Diplonema papillatum]